MGSRSQPEDQSTFDPNYTPPNTVDFATQEVLATLAAAAEVDDHIASQEAGVTRADGKQQGSRKRLISLVDDTDDSDVEISQPTQKTKPRRQTSFGTATGKPMLQSTIDGGVGSSAQVCSKGKSVPMKYVIRGGRRKSPTKSKKKKVSPTQSQKKKKKVAEDIPELGDELEVRIHLHASTTQRILTLIPREVDGARAKRIVPAAAERVPVAHRELEVILHGLASDDAVCIVPLEG